MEAESARLKTDATLMKLIRIILMQKDFAATPQIKKKSPKRRLQEIIYPPSTIQAAAKRSDSSIPLEIKQLLQAIQAALKSDPQIFQDLCRAALHQYQPDLLLKDAMLYRFSIFSQFSSDISSPSANSWKSREEEWASKVLRSQSQNSYFSPDAQGQYFLVTVQDARGLKPKNSRTSNNSYVYVTYKEVSWISPIVPNTLNPPFGFSFSIYIKKDAQNQPVMISLWNRALSNDRRGAIEKDDAFLGLIALSITDLERMAGKDEKLDAPLQRRTNLSHVSGHIRVTAEVLTPQSLEIREIHGASFQTMIYDAKVNFKALLKAFFEFDYAVAAEKKPNASLSKVSQQIVSAVAFAWRISPGYINICLLQTAFSLFRQGSLPIDHLYNYYIDALNSTSDPDGPSKIELQEFVEVAGAILETTDSVLQTFFSSTNFDRSKSVTRTQLEKILVINSSIYTSPLLKKQIATNNDSFLHIKALLEESLKARYQNLVGISQQVDPNESDPLSALALALNDELIIYSENFDIMVMEKIHLPTLAANIFYEPLSIQLENLANSYKSSSQEMTTLFQMYDSVRKFQRTCESIDFRLADKFQMVRCFGSFVKEWLSYSEAKLVEWVRSALDHDNLEKVSSQAQHSSSILDIFTSFQQLVDFLKKLDWPNEVENRRFYFAIFYDILGAIYRYCQFSMELLVSILNSTRKLQPPPSATTAKVGKFKVPIPKIYQKKVARSLQDGTRISPKACIVLLNIFALRTRFSDLLKCIPELNNPNDDGIKQRDVLNSNRFLYCITILNGTLKPIRPWMAKVAVKITNTMGKEHGMTHFTPQNKEISWNESIYGLHDSNSATLTLGIWHRIEDQKETLFSIGQISTEGIHENILEGKVRFENYGHIFVRLEKLPEHATGLMTIMNWMVESTSKKMIKLLADQLSYDFRDRIHEISLKYKANVIKATFFKDKIEPLTENDISEIEQYLTPFFDFLNSNLEVLMSSMDEVLALEVVLGSWKRFIADAEALIVPTLCDDAKERKQWDERRFQFFKKLVEIANDFFNGDGQGLSKDALHTRSFISLQQLTTHYFLSKEEVATMFLQSKDEPVDKLWLLKLIKMKGGKDFVESHLESICGL